MAKKKQSPQRELFSQFLNSRQRKELRDLLKCLKQDAVDDICTSLLIYLRYGRYTEYKDELMALTFLAAKFIVIDDDDDVESSEL